ncbi:MAG: hypothetical protein CVU57_23335 [Deltaproteobacteria bacterium HGW-Deltaproteobacteria-15]|nr:MAG: hypothetical protein CVU57_23335 [Deltaproteobacteria bacterium HGW-Deltaproteobacteria-15]
MLGDIIPGSNVSLYRVSNTDLDVILREIRTTEPVAREVVNATQGFTFPCVYPGIYAFVIPSSSYKGSRGSPLPYKFDCRNLSLDIAFQGGDSFYAVGAFSIFVPDEKNLTLCTEPIQFCLSKRGRLYKKCPLE